MKKLLSILILSAITVSCENFLERPPRDTIQRSDYWKSASDFDNYVIQFYTKFPKFGTNVQNYTGIFGFDAYQGSDHAIAASEANEIMHGTRSIAATNSAWNWSDIRAVNIFFENLASTSVSYNDIKHFIGEAHFFKAWFYFEKLKTFGDVPWYDTSLQMDSPELYNPRTPRNIVADSILIHLDRAIEYLKPISALTSMGGTNRLSQEVALAFKSRVALFEGTWEKYHNGTPFGVQGADWNKYLRAAVEAAEKLMTTASYKKGIYDTNKPAEDYGYLFGQENYATVSEVLFWKKYSAELNLGNHLQPFVSGFTANVSLVANLIRNYLDKSGNLIDYVTLSQNFQGNAFLTELGTLADHRLSQTIWMPGAILSDNSYNVNNQPKTFGKPSLNATGNGQNTTGFQARKGVNVKSATAGAPSTSKGNTGGIIFRYAEVLLNYAEAKAELGEPVDYAKSLNLLRNRAGLPDFDKNLTDASRSSYADFGYVLSNELYEIRRERAVELANEGFRTNDFRRWAAHSLFKGKRLYGYPFKQADYGTTKISIPVSTVDGITVMDPLKNTAPSGYNFDPERDYLDFIPINERTLNPNLDQNPKWE